MLFYDHREIIDTVADGFTVAGFGYKVGWGETDSGQYDGLGYVFGACGGAAMYRRDMLEDIKTDGEYFDEEYFAFGEDLDISFRAQARGYKCMAVPSARVYHRVRATAGVSSSLPVFLGNRNFMMTVFKNFPRPVLLRYSPSLVSFWLLSAFADILKTGRPTVLKAYIDAFKRRDSIKSKRAALSTSRRITEREFDALLDRGWLAIWLRTGLNTARVRKILAVQSSAR
jgi:GT2 family glycosyltransferase